MCTPRDNHCNLLVTLAEFGCEYGCAHDTAFLEDGGLVDGKKFCFVGDQQEQRISNVVPKSSSDSMKAPEKPAALAAGEPTPPYTFDVSKLHPVTKSNQKKFLKPPKIIELLDKGTNEVIVCFRGITNAHRALGIDRGFATLACLNYGTPSQPDLKDYVLRYVLKRYENNFGRGSHKSVFLA